MNSTQARQPAQARSGERAEKHVTGAPIAVVAVLAAIAFVVRAELNERILASNRSLFGIPIDFLVYRRGGELVQQGQEVYAGGLVGRLPFTYPPFSAWLFTLLAKVPAAVGATLWQLSMFLLLILVIVAIIAERGYRVEGRTVFFGILLTIASFALVPVREGFFFGQINILLMALITFDMLRSPANRWRNDSGIATGIAAGIKLVPAFFWFVFIVRRQWWALARSVAAFLVTIGVGFLFVPDATTYWSEKFIDSSRVGSEKNPGAQSLAVVLDRAFGVDNKVIWLLGCVAILALIGAVLIKAVEKDHRSAQLAFTGVAMVLVSPFSWMHHWVWVVPVLLCLGDAVISCAPKWWAMPLAVAAVGLSAVPFITRHIAPGLALSKQVTWPVPFSLSYVLWGILALVCAAAVLWWPRGTSEGEGAGEYGGLRAA